MAPIVHGLEREYGAHIDFLYLNIEEEATAAAQARLGFRATPHFFLLTPDGSVRAEWQGVHDRAVLDRALREVSISK